MKRLVATLLLLVVAAGCASHRRAAAVETPPPSVDGGAARARRDGSRPCRRCPSGPRTVPPAPTPPPVAAPAPAAAAASDRAAGSAGPARTLRRPQLRQRRHRDGDPGGERDHRLQLRARARRPRQGHRADVRPHRAGRGVRRPARDPRGPGLHRGEVGEPLQDRPHRGRARAGRADDRRADRPIRTAPPTRSSRRSSRSSTRRSPT